MALTRPKYSQIFDSDFKNSARVATTTSVTLTGGAPTVVDDVTLVLGDRVLVRSQANAVQNGIYRVNTLGTGANGTWGRAQDASTGDRLTPGTTLSVEEGTTLGGKLFRMTSVGPVTLGSTAITWTDVSGGGGSASGNNGQVQFNDTNAFGGATYLYYNKTTGQFTSNAGTASTTTTSGTFIVSGGVGVSGNLIAGGHGQFSGLFNESTTAAGVFIGNAGLPPASPRIGFFNGNTTQNWQIDNYSGTFRWFTPGVTRMELNSAGDLSIPSTTISTSTSTGALKVSGGAGIGGAVRIGGLINVSGSATVEGTLAVTGDTTITGNLTVNGTTTNINTTDLVVEDKNIIIADVATPTNTTADGAGITVKGSTDKTFNWVSLTAAWTSSEDLNLLTGKQYEINGTSVLTATTLGSGVTASSLTSLGTIATLVATNSLTTTGVVTNLSSGNVVISGGYISALTNATITTTNTTTLNATNFSSGNIVSTNSTSGTWSTANVSLYESVTASTTNATFYPMLSDKTVGNTGSFSATTLTHNPSTGNLTATGFVGAHYGSAAGLTGSAAGLTSIPSGQLTGTIAESVSSQLFNNMGQGHSTRTSFDATTPSYNFGHRFVQGSTNGPGTGGGQFYSWYMGLGSDYPATGAGSYGAMFAVDRNTTTPYLSVRYNENNAFGTWRKIQAGYADTAGTVTTAAQTNITSVGTLTGLTVSGAIVPNANLTVNLGSTTAWWNNIYGVSVQARYADLAEHYVADADYEPGTVVVFGGEKEITISTQSHDTAVAGIISTNPAYLMNAAIAGLPVALQGRVPCRVQGPVKKGDVLVTGTTPGVAQRIGMNWQPGCVLGKALESINTNNIQTIEVVVGRF